MKLLILATAIAISSTTLIAPAQALQANASHLHGSTALPKNARVPSATYRLYVHVAGAPVTQLSIDLPDGVKSSRSAIVTDESGREIATTTSFNHQIVTISFAQPVTTGVVTIDLKGIKTSSLLGRSWSLPLYTGTAANPKAIQIGTARIQTYR